MLADWLAPRSVSEFLQLNMGKLPCSGAGTAAAALPLLTWETFASVLSSPLPLDVLTVAAGQLVPAHCPTTLAQVRALMRRGISVVVRGSEQHDRALAVLADAFGRVVHGEVHVQLYATPAGTSSYGWHYDFEEVFIAQTAGMKDYFFRQNTVARQPPLGATLDFSVFRQETTPILTARLHPADWLYLPARWWHLVNCVEDSLSISIGVMPPAALRTAVHLPPGWTGELDGRPSRT